MENILITLVLIPLIGFLMSLFINKSREGYISNLAFTVTGIHLLTAATFIVLWIFSGAVPLNFKNLVLFKSENYEFFLDFYFDKISATYIIVGALLAFLVTRYSRVYLHRESGYKRFFNSILFFYLGYSVVIIAGNLETLFIGWEILGISSFLLIAFYRDRYLPVKNAIKVFSIYRIGDVGLILAMWMSHHLWNQNITFAELNNYELVHHQIQNHSMVGVFISVMILISAAAKSAQLPFSSWLPRAMEGPTPSTAIFYGSLSVHIGVFVLLRTYNFWEHQFSVRILIGMLGVFTSIVATGIARVQSSVKSQIAYASIAQIGLIFLEVALGWHNLALVHFAGNAFLRTYQLLVSPSVVSYRIKEQFYRFSPHNRSIEERFPRRIQNALYIMSIKEWNLDLVMHRVLWAPSKWLGAKLGFITVKRTLLFFIPLFLVGTSLLIVHFKIDSTLHHWLPEIFAAIGVIMVLKSFSERKSVMVAWLLIIMNHFWIVLAVSYNEQFDLYHSLIYLIGVIASGILGWVVINRLQKLEKNIDLNRFHGFVYEHPRWAFVFLIACLGLSGFPITPTFIGEDLIFSHIHEDQIALACFTAMSFVLNGLSIMRIYSRVFMGPYAKSDFDSAFRSF